MCVCTGNAVIHYIQAGRTKYDHMLRIHAQHISKKLSGTVNTLQTSVVSGIYTLIILHIAMTAENIHHRHCHIKLIRGRLSSGHVKLQTFALCILIFLSQFLFQFQQFFSSKFTIWCHLMSSSL